MRDVVTTVLQLPKVLVPALSVGQRPAELGEGLADDRALTAEQLIEAALARNQAELQAATIPG
jgi:hypothetical protein